MQLKPKLNFVIAKATALQFSETGGPRLISEYSTKNPSRNLGLATSMAFMALGLTSAFGGKADIR
jgi:hypothetical protein